QHRHRHSSNWFIQKIPSIRKTADFDFFPLPGKFYIVQKIFLPQGVSPEQNIEAKQSRRRKKASKDPAFPRNEPFTCCPDASIQRGKRCQAASKIQFLFPPGSKRNLHCQSESQYKKENPAWKYHCRTSCQASCCRSGSYPSKPAVLSKPPVYKYQKKFHNKPLPQK